MAWACLEFAERSLRKGNISAERRKACCTAICISDPSGSSQGLRH